MCLPKRISFAYNNAILESAGPITLLPALVAVVTAVLSRRPIESLLAGTASGLLILDPANFVTNFSSTFLTVMMEETIAWLIIVCGLMGSLIVLFMRTGAAVAFSHALASRTTSRPSALLATWLLGLAIFIDDYLNALAVGNAMRRVTDRLRISREMLAYVVDSTAAPICMLVPVSTWAVFFAGVLELSEVAPPGEGINLFISSIPYMLYPWITVGLIVPLVAMGRIPPLGLMRKAEAIAEEGAPRHKEGVSEEVGQTHPDQLRPASVWHFVLPLLTLIGVSWWFDLDIQIGIIVALALTILLFGIQKLMRWGAMFDAVLDGIRLMVPALAICVVAFMFKSVNDSLGMPEYVIATVQSYMTAQTLPLLTFVTMAVISFATGSSWGIFAIAIPIIMPLGAAADVSAPLMVGALMSASAFGSHACFYSDSTVLAAQGAGCDVMSHALTQLPYALIAATLAAIGLTLLA